MSNLIELQTLYKHVPSQQLEPIKNEMGHFNIFKVEDMLLKNHKPVNYSRRSFFKISLVSGHSKIHYANQCIEVAGSVLVFTNPIVPYSWEIISEQQSGFICVFTEAFFSRFGSIKEYPVFQSADKAVIPLDATATTKYNQLFVRMLAELQSDYIYKYDLLRSLLMEVIHEAQKMQPAMGTKLAGSNASARIASIFMELLERQFPIELSNQSILLNSPAAFAKQLNVHVNHLNKALKEATGQTTSQLISERILQEAKTLLLSTNWTVAEIAWGLGFEEPNHFSSFFKSRAHTTPNMFRKQSSQ